MHEITVLNNQIMVKLKKELYVDNTTNLREQLISYLEKGYKNFLLDMGEVTYIDSTGIGFILSFHKKAFSAEGKVIVKGLQGPVKEIFEITRLTNFMEIN
ncbi:STAS domain-containing protein [Calidifontibacillus oryziterrae]|uniref:STAS domain-containing protein n=1 Tax=Calidifontibacillus oryziterrae TaxID=1191699 RepID=UPI0002E440A5|nr:STAS domain-containing protein [Calidifontibacillus oryziterrae]